MEKQTYIKFEASEIKRALNLPKLMHERAALEFSQSGDVFTALCPFHNERTPSFQVKVSDGYWRYHCFGCGAGGDVISWYMHSMGYGQDQFRRALSELAGIAGIAGAYVETKPKGKQKKPVAVVPDIVKERLEERKPMPPMRPLSRESCAEIAALRKLSADGVLAAAQAGIVWGQVMGVSRFGELMWGDRMMKEGERNGLRNGGVQRCWLISDKSGLVAQARRMDGKPWEQRDGHQFKAWTIGTSRWPVGAGLIGERKAVAMVEGGPDILAAHDILLRVHGGGYGEHYAVVGMLGSAARVRAEALRLFAGKRVRIFPDQDPEQVMKGGRVTRPGIDGACNWQEALTEAGAEVDVVEWEGLTTSDGSPLKDVNDLATHAGEWLLGQDGRGAWTF